MRVGYVVLLAGALELVLGGEDDACGQVEDAVGAGAEEVVPDAADGLDAGEDVGEPGEHPGDDEGHHPHLREALQDLPQLPVPALEELEEEAAEEGAGGGDVLGEEVAEVGGACPLHHVVAGAVAEEDEEDGGDVVEALDVPELPVLAEEAVQDLQHVPLLLRPTYPSTYRWNLVMFSKVFMLASDRSASFCSCS